MGFEAIPSVINSLASPLAETIINTVSTIAGAANRSDMKIAESDGITLKDIPEELASLIKQQLTATGNAELSVPATVKIEKKNVRPDDIEIINPEQKGKRLASHTDVIVSPTFKLVFLTIVIITIGAGIAAVCMAYTGNSVNPNQQAMFDSMNTAWKCGLGAIFGLLGGKAT